MYLVRYRCTYRDHWYDDLETDDYQEAIARALRLEGAGRLVAVWDMNQRVVVYGVTLYPPASQMSW